MAKEYTIEVGGESYSGVTASAQAQLKALNYAMRSGVIASMSSDDVADMSLVAALGSMPYEIPASKDEDDQPTIKKIEDLVVKECITRDSDSVPVGVNLFRDSVQDYYLLIMFALRENVGPFWKLRRQTGAQGAEQTS